MVIILFVCNCLYHKFKYIKHPFQLSGFPTENQMSSCRHWFFVWVLCFFLSSKHFQTYMSTTAWILIAIIVWWNICARTGCRRWWRCSSSLLHSNGGSCSHIIGKSTSRVPDYGHPINHNKNFNLIYTNCFCVFDLCLCDSSFFNTTNTFSISIFLLLFFMYFIQIFFFWLSNKQQS